MATYTDPLVEHYIPCIKYAGGYRSNLDMSIGDGATVTLPSTTTIGGSSVVALGNITSSSTTATAFSVTNTGIFTGASVMTLVADSATTGTVYLESANGLTSGHAHTITSSGTIVTTGDLLSIIGNSATTSTGLVRISATSMTTGSTMLITGGGANQTSAGKVIEIAMGASTVGVGQSITTTGIYTGAGISQLIANSATTGTISSISATGLTTGIGEVVTATAATLTTGRYVSYNDSATEVFGIGANGHIHSKVSAAPPTIAVTTQNGITASAITAGGSDTCGVITTTGTSTGSTVITVTFGKTYTTAPKSVMITAANAAGGGVNSDPYVSSITATTFVLTIPPSGVYAATPSWYYLVIA